MIRDYEVKGKTTVYLSDFFDYFRGKRLKKSDRISGSIPLVTAGYQNDGIAGYISNTQETFDNAITIDMFGNCFWRPYIFSCDDNIIVLKSDNLTEKTAHYFLSAVKKYIGNFHYNNQYRLEDLKKHVMDIPVDNAGVDYKVIENISGILSKISELEAELEAELETELKARTKQYEYYLNKLLDFSTGRVGVPKIDKMLAEMCPEGIENKHLKDIGTMFFRGKGIKREDLTDSGFPCIRYGDIYTKYDDFVTNVSVYTKISSNSNSIYAEYGDLLFAITGETIEDIGKTITYIGSERIMIGGDIVIMKHNQNPKFMAYLLNSKKIVNQKIKGKNKNKVVHMSVNDIKSLILSIPPIEIQTEIVRIIDSYRDLIISTKQELLAEIKARGNQSKYFRELLVAF